MEEIRRGAHGTPISTEFVLAECLSVLRRRVGRKEVLEEVVRMFGSGPGQIRFAPKGMELVPEALKLLFLHFDRGLSLTDCLLLRIADGVNGTIASLDSGFRGLAPLLES